MRIGILTYDYDPPIGGLGVIALQTQLMLQKLFPADVTIVISPASGADERVSGVAGWCLMKAGGCPLFSFFLFFRLSSIISRHRLDLLHVHAGSGGVSLLRKPSCPLVVTAHHTYLQEAEIVFRHSPVKRLWKRLMGLLEKRTYALADRVVCVSQDTAEILVTRYGIDRSKVSVIENAVPSPVIRQILPRDEATVLFVGRLEDRKGVDVLLRAFALLKNSHPNARLRMVGKNLMGRSLDRLIEKLQLTDRVALPGYIYDPLLQREMLHATILVVPSKLEGFGLIAAQGMLVGTCVVASDSPGLRSVIKDHETGLLFTSGDAADCARVIVEALDHPELRERLQQAAKIDALKRFSPEERARDLYRVFEEALTPSCGTPLSSDLERGRSVLRKARVTPLEKNFFRFLSPASAGESGRRSREDAGEGTGVRAAQHIPVLLTETLDLLAPKAGDRVLDVTLGLGGHSEALLRAIGPTGMLLALDADEENIAIAKKNLESFVSQTTILHANFAELPDCLPQDQRQFDVILADLGLSSPHIDDPERGFTFRQDAPLDMRFDRTQGMTAAMLLASLDEEKLLKIFWEFGELPKVRRLVNEIVLRRREKPIRTSADLVDAANIVYGYKSPQVLPQIFQALRIAVNRETEALMHLLASLPLLLSKDGRCCVISYHSLEDGLVKSAFRSLASDLKDPLTGAISLASSFEILTKKPVAPGDVEVRENPRARSAHLRAIRRIRAYTDSRTC